MTRIILIRHGETYKNVAGIIHEPKDPEGLTPKGIGQIEKLCAKLKEYNPDSLYCSGEIRANESAKIISDKLNLVAHEIPELRERNWGKYSGYSFSKIKALAKMENMNFEKRYTFHPPDGESWKETESRLVKALNRVLEQENGKTVILVTHGGSIRTLMPILLGVEKTESYKYDPDNASITVFDFDKNKFSKVVYNDTGHLDQP